jgi:hypothetical protein
MHIEIYQDCDSSESYQVDATTRRVYLCTSTVECTYKKEVFPSWADKVYPYAAAYDALQKIALSLPKDIQRKAADVLDEIAKTVYFIVPD